MGVIIIIIPNQKIEINTRRHDVANYYKSKGYDVQLNKLFIIDAEDLMHGSGKEIWVKCDYCDEKYKMPYKVYFKNVLSCIVQKCACDKCSRKKATEIYRLKYGVDNPMQRKEIKNKAIETNIKRYGVDNPMKNKEIQLKVQETCYERYGYISPLQTKELQDKIKQKRIDKYGVEYIFQSPELRKKAVQTFNDKYGGVSPMCSKDIQEKAHQTNLKKYGNIHPLSVDDILSKCSITRFQNGTCIVSNEQYRISKMFNGIVNYPIGRYNVDVLLDNNIVLEYDGGAHDIDIKHKHLTYDEFIEREKYRAQYIIDKGYKLIHFINKKDRHISNDEYFEAFNICCNQLKNNTEVFYDFN